jgi:hypothetical protein
MDDLTDEAARITAAPAKGQGAKRRARGTKDNGRFVKSTEQLLILLGDVLGNGKEILVGMYIQQRVMIEGENTIKVTNQALEAWGVNRFTKYRALAKLEAAGLIEFTERPSRANPTIRIIGSLWLTVSD